MPSVNIYPTQDGYVKYDLSTCIPCDDTLGYVDWNSLPWVWGSIRQALLGSPAIYYNLGRRGYAFADLSSLPGGITYTKVEINLVTSPITLSVRDTIFYQEATKHDDYADAQALYEGLDDGSIYIQGLYNTALPTVQTINLGAQAVIDANSHPTWFGVGVLIDESSPSTEEDKAYYSTHSNISEHDYRCFFTFTYTIASSFLPRLCLLGVG